MSFEICRLKLFGDKLDIKLFHSRDSKSTLTRLYFLSDEARIYSSSEVYSLLVKEYVLTSFFDRPQMPISLYRD